MLEQQKVVEISSPGNNTNNYCEAAMRVLKEYVMFRTKSYNVCQLLEFIIYKLDEYYQRKLTDVANGRYENYNKVSRFYPNAKDVDVTRIEEVNYCF